MCNKEEEKDMFASKRKIVRKPIILKSKFTNLSKCDWKETNEQSNKDRGISGITYRDIYGRE